MTVGVRMVVACVGVCVLPHAHAWGAPSTCSISNQDVKKLEDLCSETARSVNESVAALEEKLSRIFTFIEELKEHENAWIDMPGAKSTRDVSQQGPPATLPEDPVDPANHTAISAALTASPPIPSTTTTTTPAPSPAPAPTPPLRRFEKKVQDSPGKGECESKAFVDHETIGMFYMTSFRHGHCANRNPINTPIRYCLGYCTTRTYIERTTALWSQKSDCRSCQVDKLETVSIPLVCDDGFSFHKRFKNVVSCRCQRCQVEDKES